MLKRIDNFFNFFSLDKKDHKYELNISTLYGNKAKGMVDKKDYEALTAILLQYKPKRIFEIGTLFGTTSNFFLTLLPECEVVSIAYTNPKWRILGPIYNNSQFGRKKIGSHISTENINRFTQLYGDSHKLKSKSFTKKHGYFDLVFIDGDHSKKGVTLDTEFAKKIITKEGVICWHDANPNSDYMDVRRFLENDLKLNAIATKDEYIGGIAAWSKEIENRLKAY